MKIELFWIRIGDKLPALGGATLQITEILSGGFFCAAILGDRGQQELIVNFDKEGRNTHGIENFEFDIDSICAKRMHLENHHLKKNNVIQLEKTG